MFTVLVFGNPYIEEDTLALTVAKAITEENIEFKITANLNDLLEERYDAILDVAVGIPNVVLLEDLEKLREHKLISLHDYDVSFFLKLMKAMGNIQHVKIIAIPMHYEQQKALQETLSLLKTLTKQQYI